MAENYRADMMQYNSATIQHYGVKGMHRGVRRYQNANGSLTEKGAKVNAKQIYNVQNMREHTWSFKRYRDGGKKIRKVKERASQDQAKASGKIKPKELNWGRYKVAKSRLVTRSVLTASVATIGTTGSVLIGASFLGPMTVVPLAAVGYATYKTAHNIPYYSKEVKATKYNMKEPTRKN